MDPDKIKAVMQIKQPETKKEVRQILGLFGWFRQYLPNYAEVAFPLTELTAKRVPNRVPWGSAEQTAFENLKSLLQTAVNQPLKIVEWDKPFIMRTDASDIAIAGSLSQKSVCGSERPISFYSKKLTKAQKAWPIIEREAFAVLEGLKRFNHWLFGHSIVCYSDHCPLQYITESAPKSARLMRWALALQNWSITFKYKAGNSAAMAVPDCISRQGHGDDEVVVHELDHTGSRD